MSRTEIHQDIESTRAALGDTVEALAAKTDIRARIVERMSPALLVAAAGALVAALVLIFRRKGKRR